MNMFIILTMVLFSYVYGYIKIYQIYTLNICVVYIDCDPINLYRSLKDTDWNNSSLPHLSQFIVSMILPIPTLLPYQISLSFLYLWCLDHFKLLLCFLIAPFQAYIKETQGTYGTSGLSDLIISVEKIEPNLKEKGMGRTD